MNDGKNRAVSPDAETQREDSDRGKTRCFDELAKGRTEIGHGSESEGGGVKVRVRVRVAEEDLAVLVILIVIVID
jgi:hypothetical protein